MRHTLIVSDLPVLPFRNQRAFETWLSKNHAKSRGVWIKTAKAKSGIRSINYAQALEAALCWGWIDGQSRRVDDEWYVQKFTPRAPRSLWSKINCGKAEALIASGKMKPTGLAEVERAKSDGRWGRAYDSWSGAQVPDDLAAALGRNKRASAFFAGLNSRNRYAILHRIQTVKKADTRARRIAEFVRMLARREKLYP
jgi:uncharacterized protein YdeI (YjbR/CyaY-like superfamily)